VVYTKLTTARPLVGPFIFGGGMEREIGPYLLVWPADLVVTEGENLPDATWWACEWGALRYEVVDHRYLGLRLVITEPGRPGRVQDMPFHLGTAGFLPPKVALLLR